MTPGRWIAVIIVLAIGLTWANLSWYSHRLKALGLDPDEIKTIAGLAPGAAAAYDNLDAEAMKREVESIRREVESLQTRLAEAQIQPA